MCPFFLGKTVCVCICAPCRLCRGALLSAKKGHVFVFCHERVFPVNLKKQLSNVYLYTFFSTFTITDAVWFLHSMQRLNDSISSDRRATLISVDSMAYSLLMIPASPVLGWLGDVTGQAGAGLCVLGGAVLLSGLAVAGKTRYNGGRAG